jgi:hypothetical protein
MTEPDSEPREKPDPKTEERERRQANMILLAGFVLVVGISIWLVNALLEQGRIDDCAAQGRRNCAPVETAR